MISKELLSEVLRVIDAEIIAVDEDDIFFLRTDFDQRRVKGGICLHTLAHKVKEWIIDRRNSPEMLCSHKTFYCCTDGMEWYCGYASIKTTYDNIQTVQDVSKGDTEIEAIFNAGQWVLDGKNG